MFQAFGWSRPRTIAVSLGGIVSACLLAVWLGTTFQETACAEEAPAKSTEKIALETLVGRLDQAKTAEE
ncbi:MAG: hypothetical protein D6782_06115, partial [Alphaproteobacteria bacterium]